MTEISIIIPTHNRWPLLRRTLAGALAQEDVDHEVIVVDDGSGDETPERLADLEEPRLRVVRNESALGVARARNRGLEEARGKWVGFLDDDDVWSPRKLRCQLDAANEADACFAYVSALLIDTELRVLDLQRAPDTEGFVEEILRWCAVPGGCSNVITQTELAQEVGGFDAELRVAEDWDMWIRLMLAGNGRAARSYDLLYGYVQHDTSSVLKNRHVILADYEHLDAKHAQARREYGVETNAVVRSRWLAGNHRRAGDRRGAARIYLSAAREQRNLGHVIRAAGLLFGERTMRRLSRYKPEQIPHQEWLDLYQPGGRLESVPLSR